MKEEKGITLITLVITIIILLILAGVTIATLTGEGGILSKAKETTEEFRKQSAKEKIQLAITAYKIDEGKTTIYDELIKIEGLTSITPNDKNKGPEYTVIVDGYEYLIKKDLTIEYIKKPEEEGNIFSALTIGEVNEQAKATVILRGQGEGIAIKAMELYIEGEKVKTYQYQDVKNNREEIYEIENLEFYQEKECFVKVYGSNAKEEISTTETVMNRKIIATETDLKNLAIQVNNNNNTFKGETIQLIGDITTKENWVPIGYYDGIGTYTGKYFSGNFEGNNHTITISSLSKDSIYKSNGLFGMIIEGEINNLTVNGKMDSEMTYIGGIAGGIKNGKIYNCVNNSNNLSATGACHGGIAGITSNATIERCINTGQINGEYYVGGISGLQGEKSVFDHCTNSGKIRCYGSVKKVLKTAEGNYGVVGGITGEINNSVIKNCSNLADVSGNHETMLPNGMIAGGIAGFSDQANIETSKNVGRVHYDLASGKPSNSGALGGIAGLINLSTINQCFNTGAITAQYGANYGLDNVGGIVGMNIDGAFVKNTYNIGAVYGSIHVGGIVGASDSTVCNSYNASKTIVGEVHVGNLIGLSNSMLYSPKGIYLAWIKELEPIGYGGGVYSEYGEYTLAQMKSSTSGLLTMLNKGEGTGIWEQSADINNKLPYLKNNLP